MRVDRFVTPTWHGHIDIPDRVISLYNSWTKFERELDPDGATQSTTRNGWQHIFKFQEPDPDWLLLLNPELNKIKQEIGFTRIKDMWTVEYNPGGYQDPHFHNNGANAITSMVVNLQGEGELVIQDPRPMAMSQGVNFAEVIKLMPGDWVVIPSYLIHSSRPALKQRSILVIDCYVNTIL
jgi:hypothetical protein